MFDANQLATFIAAVFFLVLLPGPNTMVILAHSLAGRAAGLATVAGVELGTMIHTLAVAVGLSALISTSPVAFAAVKYAGVAYLLFAGIRAILKTSTTAGEVSHMSKVVAFRRALLTNILNPKSAVFFLAFLPQFVHPERGHLFAQFVTLGAIVSLVGICIGTAEVFAAASLSAWLRGHALFWRWQQRVTGAILITIAVLVMFVQR